jgi:hypothetical protein
MVSAPVEGADVVRGTAEAVYQGFSNANSEVRSESFSEACSRLGISEQKLALIHNQLLVQIYVIFFAGLAALTIFINTMLIGSGVMVALAALAGSLACFSNAAQASLQAYRVRTHKLCNVTEWIGMPSEWLPSRLPITGKINLGDSRLDPGMHRMAVVRSKKYFIAAAVVSLCSLPAFLSDSGSILRVEYGAIGFCLAFLVVGSRYSILALQSYERKEVDFTYWLKCPGMWWPPTPQVKRSSKSKDKTDSDKAQDA